MCTKWLYSAVILGFIPWWGSDAGGAKDLTAGDLESVTNTFLIQGNNGDVIWYGRAEFDYFFWVPGATTACADILIKMSLVCKMLRSDTVHHKTMRQVPALGSRASFFFFFVKQPHSTGCCLLSFYQWLYPTVFPHSLLTWIWSVLLWDRPCEHPEKHPNSPDAFGSLQAWIFFS